METIRFNNENNLKSTIKTMRINNENNDENNEKPG